MNYDSKPSYYAIIPANVRYDSNVTPNAKLLYGEITALCNEKGFCWASNDYFAVLYGVSTTSISKWVSSLAKNGYVNVSIKYKEGTKQILNRYITILIHPIEDKLNTPIEDKLRDSTTVLNNTVNNTNTVLIVFDYYTSKDLVKHKGLTDSMKKGITKVLKTYTVEELKEFIDRHETVVNKTKTSNFKVKKRGLDVFFSQKLTNDAGSPKLYEEYLEGGAKYETYLKDDNKSFNTNNDDVVAPKRRDF